MKPYLALIVCVPSLAWAQSYSNNADAQLDRFRLGGPRRTSRQPADSPAAQGTNPRSGSRISATSESPGLSEIQSASLDPPRRRTGQPNDSSRGSRRDRDPGPGRSSRQQITPATWQPAADLREENWPAGTVRIRVRYERGTDYGSAVCVGYGRQPGEWTFLSCSHNLESGGDPELQVRGQWIPATVLYRDRLAKAVKTGPGQYTRVSSGPDRSVLVAKHSGPLPFCPVTLQKYLGEVALNGFPSTSTAVTISGRTEPHKTALKADLSRPSQGGFSGGGVFNRNRQLVGIWTSGAKGAGYGHYVAEFVPIFRKLGWVPGNWPTIPGARASAESGGETLRQRPTPALLTLGPSGSD